MANNKTSDPRSTARVHFRHTAGLILVVVVAASAMALDGASGAGTDALQPGPCQDGNCLHFIATDPVTAELLPGTGIFSTDGFVPRWNCGAFTPLHGWTHIVADLLIFGAYAAIPVLLAFFILRRRDIPFPRLFWLFGLFIFACGATHLIEASLFIQPWYRLSAFFKVLTAVVSWATVIALVPVIPKALALPGLADVNARLRREIEQRTRAEAETEAVNAELRRRNEEMERFVYTVSHDLKAPIVTIQGFVNFLETDLHNGQRDALDDSITRIRRGADRMMRMIDDLLELSRVGCVAHSLQTVDVCSVVRQVAEDLNLHLQSDDLAIEIERTMPSVKADPIRLCEVFENLLTNAIKYGCTSRRAVIRIGSRTIDDEVRFFVQDNGRGIDPRFTDRIFELFQRLDGDHDGSGIGLAIVRQIMEAHGGSAWVESKPGDGATFWIAFPNMMQQSAAVPPDEARLQFAS